MTTYDRTVTIDLSSLRRVVALLDEKLGELDGKTVSDIKFVQSIPGLQFLADGIRVDIETAYRNEVDPRPRMPRMVVDAEGTWVALTRETPVPSDV